jgi:phosphatidate cytidylyltransferase
VLIKRLLVVIVLLPIGLLVIHLGGVAFFAVVALFIGLASWEYVSLFRAGGLEPASALVVMGGLSLVIERAINGFESAPWVICLLVIASMTYHLVAYERGRDQAGTDFSVTMAGALYAGWLGAYLISLRQLPDGEWWFLVVLPGVWLADSGAYFVGKKYGHHKLSPRLSPHKTWEGYLAGIITGMIGTALLAALWRIGAGPGSAITYQKGALLGTLLAIITPLGDLGESMIKRQVGKKDSSNLIPGHGGAFDRIDSWLWAAPIGYYTIIWFLL